MACLKYNGFDTPFWVSKAVQYRLFEPMTPTPAGDAANEVNDVITRHAYSVMPFELCASFRLTV